MKIEHPILFYTRQRMIYKNILLFLFTSIFASYSNILFSQEEETEEHHCLMEENSLSLGVGAKYFVSAESIGVASRFYYNHSEHLCFGPEFSYLKSSEAEIVDIGFVAHYIFETPLVGIYPVVGANYATEKTFGHEEEKHDGFGFVYGAGFHRSVQRFTFYLEYTQVSGAINDQFGTFGLMYNL